MDPYAKDVIAAIKAADAGAEAKLPPPARLRTKPHVIFAVQNGGPRNRRERRALAPEARRAWEQKLVDSYDALVAARVAKEAREAKAKSDREAAEKAEAERVAKQKALEAENAKLRAEAEAAEAEKRREIAKARADAEARELAERAEREKAEAVARAEREKAAAAERELAAEREPRGAPPRPGATSFACTRIAAATATSEERAA